MERWDGGRTYVRSITPFPILLSVLRTGLHLVDRRAGLDLQGSHFTRDLPLPLLNSSS